VAQRPVVTPSQLTGAHEPVEAHSAGSLGMQTWNAEPAHAALHAWSPLVGSAQQTCPEEQLALLLHAQIRVLAGQPLEQKGCGAIGPASGRDTQQTCGDAHVEVPHAMLAFVPPLPPPEPPPLPAPLPLPLPPPGMNCAASMPGMLIPPPDPLSDGPVYGGASGPWPGVGP
jgi:hypothetical protein